MPPDELDVEVCVELENIDEGIPPEEEPDCPPELENRSKGIPPLDDDDDVEFWEFENNSKGIPPLDDDVEFWEFENSSKGMPPLDEEEPWELDVNGELEEGCERRELSESFNDESVLLISDPDDPLGW